MTDPVEQVRAQRVVSKRNRKASWAARGEKIAILNAHGFAVDVLDRPAEQHHRIKIHGYGFVDFWPATWRWHEKKKGEERFSHGGDGFDTMLARLQHLQAERS